MRINKEFPVSFMFCQGFESKIYCVNLTLNITLQGEPGENGFLVDYKELSNLIKPYLDMNIDHRTLMTVYAYEQMNKYNYLSSPLIDTSIVCLPSGINTIDDYMTLFIQPDIKDLICLEYNNVSDVYVFSENDPFIRLSRKNIKLNDGNINEFVDYNMYPNKIEYFNKLNNMFHNPFIFSTVMGHRIRTQQEGGTCLRLHGHDYLFLTHTNTYIESMKKEYSECILLDNEDPIFNEIEMEELSYVITTYDSKKNKIDMTYSIFNQMRQDNDNKILDTKLEFFNHDDQKIFYDIKLTSYIPTIENIVMYMKNKYDIKSLCGSETPSTSCLLEDNYVYNC